MLVKESPTHCQVQHVLVKESPIYTLSGTAWASEGESYIHTVRYSMG